MEIVEFWRQYSSRGGHSWESGWLKYFMVQWFCCTFPTLFHGFWSYLRYWFRLTLWLILCNFQVSLTHISWSSNLTLCRQHFVIDLHHTISKMCSLGSNTGPPKSDIYNFYDCKSLTLCAIVCNFGLLSAVGLKHQLTAMVHMCPWPYFMGHEHRSFGCGQRSKTRTLVKCVYKSVLATTNANSFSDMPKPCDIGWHDLFFIVQWFWCMSMIAWDNKSVWLDVWPQNKSK